MPTAPTHLRSRAKRRLWRWAAVPLLLIALGGLAAPAAADPVAITQGAPLDWGFKASWLSYAGAGEPTDGATWQPLADYPFIRVSWGFDSGSYDANESTTVLRYQGTVHWTKYPASQFVPPAGYDGPLDIHLLDVTLRDPIVTISRDTATITAIASSRQLDTWRMKDFGRVAVVTLDVGDHAPTVADGQTRWSAIPALANPEAGAVFGSNYPPGIPVDAVSLSYTGPGGAPDLSEQFDAPGTMRLALEQNAFSVPEDSPSEDNQRYATAWVDPKELIAHRVETNMIVAGPPEGGIPIFTTTLTFQAFDLRQMRNVGDPLTVSVGSFGGVAFADTANGRLFLTSQADLFSEAETKSWVRYDREQGRYVRGDLAAPIPKQDPNSTLQWDPVGRRAYALAQVSGAWHLFTYVEQEDGSWVRRDHSLPAAPGGNAGVTYGPTAVASDGSLIAVAGNQADAGTSARIPGAYRIVAGDTGPATSEPIAGSEIDNNLEDRFDAATSGPGGVVALVRAAGREGTRDAQVRLLDVTPASGPIRAADPVALPFGGTADGGTLWSDFDPEDGTLWLASGQGKQFVAVRGGRVVADQRIPKRYPEGGPIIVAADHTLYAQTSTGADHNFGLIPPIAFGRFSRSVSPTVAEQPVDRTIRLAAGETSEVATFRARATADPAPTITWQVRAPGAQRFSDLADATGETLTVDAQRGMDGTQYRAVFANAAGRLATEPATLQVEQAPSITFEPLDATVNAGQDASFELLAVGNPEPTITWERQAGGDWQPIGPADDGFAVSGGTLTLTDAKVGQSGTQVRAKVANSVGSVYSRTAKITVQPGTEPPDGDLELDGVGLEWTGNAELQKAAPNGGTNYFSAGVSDGTQATYRASDGDASVLQVSAAGARTPATWATRSDHVANGGSQRVHLGGGDAVVHPDGSATVDWTGAFTVNFYGGLVPFTLTNPRLTVAAGGAGTLTADLSGYASSRDNPNVRQPLTPAADVVVATFSGVAIDTDGAVTVTPRYAGVQVTVPSGTMAQDRTVAGWGAWPQPFVDFQVQTGLSSYWYSSGGVADAFKAPAPFVVDFTDAHAPTTPPTTPPTGPPGGDTGSRSQPAPAPDGPPVVTTDTPSAAPEQMPPTAPIAPPAIASTGRRHVLSGGGTAVLATVDCDAQACPVSAPRTVTVRIAGRPYRARIIVRQPAQAGDRATVSVRLPRAAVKRLSGRRATIRVPITAGAGATRTSRTLNVTLSRPKAARLAG